MNSFKFCRIILSLLLGGVFFHCGIFSAMEKTAKPAPQSIEARNKVEFFWIGHATVLMRIYDKWIITDPNFSKSTGLFVKRLAEPGIDLNSIKPVDAILISHNHFDHLDVSSLKLLTNSNHLFAPKTGFHYIPKNIATNLHYVENDYSSNLDGLKITAVPALHFGGRLFIDNLWDDEPYTGYIIQYKDITIYFAGDTGYDQQVFTSLRNKYKIDLAFIPVGPAGGIASEGLGNVVHVNPYGAIQIFKDSGAKYMIPIHHSTFYTRGGIEMEQIKDSISTSGRSDDIILLEAGDGVEFEKTALGLKKRNILVTEFNP
ncbi:MBL fold metallo-hydrolase [Leptospira sp. 96542]|nr:MBL fold metallo-hydrolase [Leptospira sp. 96542]